jgi:hypothetical protein
VTIQLINHGVLAGHDVERWLSDSLNRVIERRWCTDPLGRWFAPLLVDGERRIKAVRPTALFRTNGNPQEICKSLRNMCLQRRDRRGLTTLEGDEAN